MKSKNYALVHLCNAISDCLPGGKAIFSNLFNGINFSLNLVKNKGAAWGLFQQYPQALTYTRIVIVAYLARKIFFSQIGTFKKLCFTLIGAGALGNLIDHFRYGYVVDMFHFTFWSYDFPVFNIADTCIFLGALGLIFSKGKLRL